MIENGYEKLSSNFSSYLVKHIEKDGQPINPLSVNSPGKKWWKIFKQHHLEISLRKPMNIYGWPEQSVVRLM